MEPLVSQDLRAATIRLAATLPAGSSSRRALLQVLASNRTAGKSGESVLGERHPEVKRAIESLSKKFRTLGDEVADLVDTVDKVQENLERQTRSTGDEQTDEEAEVAEAAGAASRLLRALRKIQSQLSAENDSGGTFDFYKREL